MRKELFVLFAATLAAVPAYADDVKVSAADCRALVQHVPSADVEYKLGVDVNGNAVAPADLGGGYNFKLPEEITIPIGVPLARRLAAASGTTTSSSTSSSSAATSSSTTTPRRPNLGYVQAGTLSVKGNDVYWNGEPLGQQDQVALAEACRKGLDQKPAQP